ncbi:hypothetical protein [Isoptericola sp. NPDC056134]|uniref:DUF7620 family protein n=1 Tax=Isoptericola sp. NPDC056134 TaxID=3345723 RepID=UPI0035ECC8D6
MSWRRRPKRERAQAEADKALQTSVDALHATVERGREVRSIAARLRKIQQENHFGPSIAEVYRGGQP